MKRNIEIKAHLRDPLFAAKTATRIATSRLPDEHQVDTYFYCQSGRLKLREINESTAQLIWYRRPDQAAAKASDYEITPITEPRRFKQMLSEALGVRGVVDKQRAIFLLRNVRIHLDKVDGLGHFIEFEAVLASPDEVERGRAIVDQLQQTFRLDASDLLTGSYGEMIGR